MLGWHAKMYANKDKVGMMHESKSQHIGEAPFLHLFTLQLDRLLEIRMCTHQCVINAVIEYLSLIPTDYNDQSAAHLSSVSRQLPEACDNM